MRSMLHTKSATSTAAANIEMTAGIVVKPLAAETRLAIARAPEPGEIRVRIEGCGLCGSNLAVWEGKPWFEYPREPGAPGHEAWGRVDALGEGVSDLALGTRVAMLSDHAFAEYDVTLASNALRLPEALDGTPFPGEPLACAMNVFDRSAVESGQSVAIVGIGFLGAVLTRLAKLAGARVAAISRRAFATKTAQLFGADAVFGLTDASQTAKDALIWNRNQGFDCVIEAAGTQSTLDLSTQLTRERGRLVIAGYHQDGARQIDMQLWNWRGLDVINAHERDPRIYMRGLQAAAEAVATKALDPCPLYTHTFPLSELSKAFEMLRLRPDGFLKALVIP